MFDQNSLESFIQQNAHAFMPGESFAGHEHDNAMLSYTVNEKDQSFAVIYPRAVLDKIKSREVGYPQYTLMPYISIRQPGETSLVIDRPIKPEDAQRFPRQWANFQAKRQNQAIGTPLEAMFPFHPELVLTLKASNILTVEALAGLTDTAMQFVGHGGREMKERAQRYLEAVRRPEGAAMADRDEQFEKLQAEVHAMRENMARQTAHVAQLQAELAVAKTGASVGQLTALPTARDFPSDPSEPTGYTTAPLGPEISEDEWMSGGQAVQETQKRGPGRPPKPKG